MSYNVGTMFLL